MIHVLSAFQDVFLIKNGIAAAHSSDVSTESSVRVRIVIKTHDRVSLLDHNVIRQLHRHGFLVKSVKLSVVGLCKSLTGSFPADHIASCKPAEEEDRNHEERGDEGHEDAGGTAILVPGMQLTVFLVLHHIINKLKFEVYTIKLVSLTKVNTYRCMKQLSQRGGRWFARRRKCRTA